MSLCLRRSALCARPDPDSPSAKLLVLVILLGSEQESRKPCILRGFLKNEEFGLGRGQALRLQQQIVRVSVTTATSEQSFDVAVDGFNHSHRYLRPAVVQDALEMIQ